MRYKREELEELGVYKLRELGREVGVRSPTSKKAGVLVEEILKITSGEMQIEPKSNKGRKPKSFLNPSEPTLKKLIPDDISEIVSSAKALNSDEFFINELIFNSNIESQEEIFFDAVGYLKKTAQSHFYFWNQENGIFVKDKLVYIPDTVSNNINLVEGLKIECKVSNIEERNCFVAIIIDKINGTPYEKYSICESPAAAVIPQKREIVFGEDVSAGGRNIVFFNDRIMMAKNTLNAVNQSNDGIKNVFIGADLPPEIVSHFAMTQNIDYFITSFGDSFDATINTVVNAINYIRSLQLQRKSVRVFVYDVIGLQQILLLAQASQQFGQVNALQIIKTLFALGKYGEDGSFTSISFVALLSEKDSTLIKTELSRVCSVFIAVN